ncbi:DsbA family protein [Frondihabitans australicus]|uniref:Protein-disulfide isomerase n=1 Tax=Frondihabitans australicus TaxID=386892 RepID=A0A495II23_9MICO|nr:thioredoxin domain-containing protein [Frondihabitans australicus]RKR75350.1 protein-disulfide isomerase [Frondihabitans australicus]
MSDTGRNRRREAAREKAQLARRRQKRRARGARWAIQGAIALVVVAVVVVVIVVVRGSSQPSDRTPQNMAGDGITIGQGFKAVRAGAGAVTRSPAPTSTAKADTVQITVYSDYLCPFCASFEKTNDSYIRQLVDSGAATITFHPIAILNAQSQSTKYSQRAANAAACVATYSPDAFFDFNAAMFRRQPAEGTPGLTNAQLVSLIEGVNGVTNTSRIEKCVDAGTFSSWVTDATTRAVTGPLPGSTLAKVKSTPTILVDGAPYKFSTPFTTSEFRNFVVTAAGNSYNDSATATPTPTPTPSSTPRPGNTKIGTPAPK